MMKIEVTKKHTAIEMEGTLQRICTDLANILSGVNNRLTEMDPKVGHLFKVSFTNGFMDGVCFDTDREHMEHYLAEGDDAKKRVERATKSVGERGLSEVLNEFMEFLKTHENPLTGTDNDDEDDDDETE